VNIVASVHDLHSDVLTVNGLHFRVRIFYKQTFIYTVYSSCPTTNTYQYVTNIFNQFGRR